MSNNISMKDAAAIVVEVKTTDTAGVHTIHHNVDSSALPTLASTSTNQVANLLSLGSPADAAATTDTGTFSLIALMKRLLVAAPDLGQQLSSASSPVVLASDQSSVVTTPSGGVAHDSVDSANPIKIGAKAIAALNAQTMVATNDRTNLHADLDGAMLVRENAAVGDYVSGVATNTSGASTAVLSAGAAGIKHHITDVTFSNTSAANITVDLLDGATLKWTFPVPANGGVTHNFKSPLVGTAATAWNFDPSAATTTVSCSVSGYKSKL